MNESKSNLKLYWTGFRSKAPFSLIGFIFIIVTLLLVFPLLIIMENLIKDPYENYNYAKIIANGKLENAKVTSTEIKYNVSFNGINPRIISYSFKKGASTALDKFQTIDIKSVDSINKKDSIEIFVLNNQSVINNVKPYSFPFKLLWTFPAILLLLGIPLFFIGHSSGMHFIRNQGNR